MAQTAPYFPDLADGPADGAAFWLTTSDDVRIRVGHWGLDAPKGTVLLFPGRSEYVEKYGRAARDLRDRGFATVTIDWRGQGLADRLRPSRMLGHVDSFSDYQRDISAMMEHVRASGLPKPYYLLAHSMGGCIGLRSLYKALPVEACAFTAPMWGIQMASALRPVAWTLSSVSRQLRMSHLMAPGQTPDSYVLRTPFEENHLTSDPEMFAWLQEHLRQQPDMGLGGPSLRWLNESLFEMLGLARKGAPQTPALTFLGSDEAIVDTGRIRDRMKAWPGGVLVEVEGARHEIMMETPAMRGMMFDRVAEHFVQQSAHARVG